MLAEPGEDVERGLRVQQNEPGLLELRGDVAGRRWRTSGALDDFNQAITSGALTECIFTRLQFGRTPVKSTEQPSNGRSPSG